MSSRSVSSGCKKWSGLGVTLLREAMSTGEKSSTDFNTHTLLLDVIINPERKIAGSL